MPAPSMHLIPAAKEDLQDIWRYTVKKWGRSQAELYISSLKSACHQLIFTPTIGRPAANLGKNVRIYRHQHHYIFYLEKQADIIFLAFLHEKRDILQHMLSRL